ETALKALIKSKASGKPVKIPERAERLDNVINLMDALQRSLKAGGGAKHNARPSHRAAKKASRSTARHRKAS
ncbi:MAG: Ku protein, partial [Xanthobacteraceae bacterium]|nr:Ku protein [Xanthobacteraceae bacterium]